jgi:hypothetical protein
MPDRPGSFFALTPPLDAVGGRPHIVQVAPGTVAVHTPEDPDPVPEDEGFMEIPGRPGSFLTLAPPLDAVGG